MVAAAREKKQKEEDRERERERNKPQQLLFSLLSYIALLDASQGFCVLFALMLQQDENIRERGMQFAERHEP